MLALSADMKTSAERAAVHLALVARLATQTGEVPLGVRP